MILRPQLIAKTKKSHNLLPVNWDQRNTSSVIWRAKNQKANMLRVGSSLKVWEPTVLREEQSLAQLKQSGRERKKSSTSYTELKWAPSRNTFAGTLWNKAHQNISASSDPTKLVQKVTYHRGLCSKCLPLVPFCCTVEWGQRWDMHNQTWL